jgi:hypothetical protein
MADVTGMLQAAAGGEPPAPVQQGALMVLHPLFPYIASYSWGPNGFRNNYKNPFDSTPSIGVPQRLVISPNEDNVAIVGTVSPYVRVYPWSSSGFGNAYANPATVPVGEVRGVTWNNAQNVLALVGSSGVANTRQNVYAWSGSGFGTRFANPAVAVQGTGRGVVFTPNDDAIIFATQSAPYVEAYAWNNTTGYGSKFANASGSAQSPNEMTISPNGNYIAVAHTNTPFVSVWSFSPSTGWGSKFSNPATLPAGQAWDVKFNHAGTALAVAHDNTPYCTVYPWSASGFGTAYSSAGKTLVPRNGLSVGFSLDDTHLAIGYDGNTAVASTSSPYLKVWEWDNTTGFGNVMSDPFGKFSGTGSPENGGRTGGFGYSVVFTSVGEPLLYREFMFFAQRATPYILAWDWRAHDGIGRSGTQAFANPATLAREAIDVSVAPDGSAVVIGTEVSPFWHVYPWTVNGFGTKYSNPATLPSFVCDTVFFNNAGNVLAGCGSASPYVLAYAWSSSSGFGTKFADPVTAVAGSALDGDFSTNDNFIGIAHNNSPRVTVYEWSNTTGFGAKVADPTTLPTGNGSGICWTAGSNAIIVGHSTSPYVSAYAWSASGFGTKYSNPGGTLPTPAMEKTRMAPNFASFVGRIGVTPFITGYPWNNSTGFGTQFSGISPTPGTSAGLSAKASISKDSNAICIPTAGSPYICTHFYSSGGFGARWPVQPSVTSTNLGHGSAFGRIKNVFS